VTVTDAVRAPPGAVDTVPPLSDTLGNCTAGGGLTLSGLTNN
jgi:hypothetical protein